MPENCLTTVLPSNILALKGTLSQINSTLLVHLFFIFLSADNHQYLAAHGIPANCKMNTLSISLWVLIACNNSGMNDLGLLSTATQFGMDTKKTLVAHRNSLYK